MRVAKLPEGQQQWVPAEPCLPPPKRALGQPDTQQGRQLHPLSVTVLVQHAVLPAVLPLPCAGGAKAMCFGCASFAAFSTAIEYFTGGM